MPSSSLEQSPQAREEVSRLEEPFHQQYDQQYDGQDEEPIKIRLVFGRGSSDEGGNPHQDAEEDGEVGEPDDNENVEKGKEFEAKVEEAALKKDRLLIRRLRTVLIKYGRSPCKGLLEFHRRLLKDAEMSCEMLEKSLRN